MSNVPEGAQVSEDGHWWWDGSQWQPVQGGQGGGHGAAAPAAGGQGGAAGLHQALAQQGVHVDAGSVGDHEAVQRVISQLSQWYAQLDQTSKAIVDSLSSQGLTHLLADAEVGVVQEGHDFLYSLASTGHTLGSALEGANAAVQQSGGTAQA